MRMKIQLACVASMLALSHPALAQDTAQDAPEQLAEGDIVVTANRTSSLLSKTPIAMSAVSGDDLIAAGITNPTQLEESVPNLSIVRGNGLQITIRGVTSTDGTEKGDPSAAFLVNGIYVARPQAQEVSFFDIERIEVLRGPQGTLYGRNATAGVINILTAQPKFELGARADVVYASYETVNATAVLNIPASDTLAFRVSANIDQRNNFLIDGNADDGVTLDRFKNNKSVRLSALFKPSADLSLLLIGDYSTIKGNTTNGLLPTNFFSAIPTGVRPTFDRPTYANPSSEAGRTLARRQSQQAFRDNTEAGVTAELNYTFGDFTVTYLGGYRESERREFNNSGAGLFSSDFTGSYWQNSQELRLAYGGDGPLQAQIGGYYFKEQSGIAAFLNNLRGPNTRFGFPQDPTIAENKSVFGQATYEIATDLRLTGGVRYSHDLKSRIGNTVIDTYSSIGNSYSIGDFIRRDILQDNAASRTFSEVTWRAGIDYDSALGLIFASVSTGYKAGGFNDGCEIGQGPRCTLPANALYYDPETLTAYEAGFKFRIADGFRLNGTAFHYDYRGLQLSQLSEICGGPCQVTTNAAAAKIDGVELDAVVQPSDNLAIRFQLNWLDARYAEFRPHPTINFAGRALNRSSEWSWVAGINYTVPVGDGRLVFDAQTVARSEYEVTDLGQYAYFFQPAFTKTDLSLTYNAPNDRFYVSGFVENLEDNLVITGASTGLFGTVNIADPRTFGVRAGIKF